MRQQKKLVFIVVATLVFAYAGIGISPLKNQIGRNNPALASLFAPIFFNFSHKYTSGSVLDFSIGMSKDAFFDTLKKQYNGRADFIVGCVGRTANSLQRITSKTNLQESYGSGNRFCGRLDSRRTSIIVEFENDVVSAINLTFVRTEGT
jgi:hypothetical protein